MSETPVFGTRGAGLAFVPRTAAYAVIQDDNGLVAFVRGETHIWLVGGGTEHGESPEDTINREALDEAGRELIIHRVIGAARQYFEVGDVHYDMHATFFEATFGDAVAEAQETIVWLDPMQAGEQIFYESHRWAIERCVEAEARRP